MHPKHIPALVRAAQSSAFEAAARQALEQFRPRIAEDGANRFAIPADWGRSNSELPVRTYCNPRTGALLVYGVDHAAWRAEGRVRVIPLR